jgi:hypothetical protein
MGFSKIYKVLCNKEFSTWGHAVTHWPLNMEGWKRTQASLFVICGEQRGTAVRFPPSTAGLSFQYRSIN